MNLKEYRNITDLPSDLKKEIENNETFFNNVDGKSLDEQQRIACVLNDCDLEIIAGAGTGKTQTLVAKSSYLIEKKNIEPSEILCLSFSNASVDDLSKRLIHPIETRTIHSLGLSIIRDYEDKDVFNDNEFYDLFNHYLEDASPKQLFDIQYHCETYLAKSKVKIKLNEIESDEEKLNYLIANTYIRKDLKQFVSLFKAKDYDISDLPKFKKDCEKDLNGSKYYYKNMSFLNIADSVFRYYQSYLSRNHLIDFNDMINKAIKIINDYGFDRNYKYIFVDEYQDMSLKNFQLLKAIKNDINANLVVVGDDWQSIYGFRDSDLKLFTNFDEYFKDSKRGFIEKTYRSPQQLIDTAGNFIMQNENQFKKSLISDSSIEKPIKIVYHSHKSEEENHIIYNLIYNLSKENEVLILARHAKNDIDEFLYETNLVKKGRTRNHKIITNSSGAIENVEFRTIHAAKGLEADYVIIIQVINDWLGFPNKLSPSYFMTFIQDWDKDDKFDEERRLFYVALTRAKKGVYIFTTKSRESKYISELKEESLENLEIIHTDDKDTYSHLNEFKDAPKPKKRKTVKQSKVKVPLIDVGNDKGIQIKANQKELGNSFMKSKDYDGAIDFYQKLITNMYYLNDYYPYRKLVEAYRKKKDSKNVIKTIEEFFKSERYCDNSQILWFKYEFRRACEYSFTNFSEFDEYLKYFNNHGLKNKDKQNDPVPIAARIKIKGGNVKIIPQDVFEKEHEEKELSLEYKFARKYGSSKETLYYLEQLWNQEGFKRNLTAYKRLCSLYEDTGQYDKVIEVANDYFESNAKRTRTSPDWFKKKIKKAEAKLNKKGAVVKDEFIRNENIKIKKEKDTSPNNNIITVARNNFTKLLSCNIGDEIIVKNSRNLIKMEILNISNPYGINEELDGKVKISVARKNFNVIENVGSGGVIIIKHKNYPGQIDLKIIKNNF